jgi:hypothetical protein
MAVRDEDPQRDAPAVSGRSLPWQEVVGNLPAVLAVGGVLVYAYLSIGYDLFYSRLGVDASDVGLSYAGVLAHAVGFVVIYLFVLTLLLVGIVVVKRDRARRRGERNQQRGRNSAASGAWGRFVVAMAVVVFAILIVNSLRYPLLDAGDAARDVQAGRPVGPIRYAGESNPLLPIPRLPLFAIHADPATVEPAGKPGDAPAAERLHGRELLYLGQADGTVVLYDPDPAVQQAVYVSASSIILRVSNCDAEPTPDPVCSKRRSY